MHLIRKAALAAIAGLGLMLPAVAAERAIIVLDGSGSMWAQIDGKARITIARETLSSVLAELPDDLELGFMTYGHREKGNCEDIELLVEPAPGTGAAIIAAADDINPKGMTPISDAVRIAAEDLRFTEEKATVILITDGLETCEVDPCQLASELEGQGIDFTTHVLGFGLSDEEGQQVACLAENTGGQYLSAADGDALVDALTTTVAQVIEAQPEPEPQPAPEPAPAPEYNYAPTASLAEGAPDITDGGVHNLTWQWYHVNSDGSKGEWVGTDYYARFKGTLEPGEYIMTAEYSYAVAEQPVTIVEGEVAEPHFVLNGAYLKLRPRPSEGADIDSEASLEIRSGGDYVTTDYGDTDLIVPAGEIEVIVKLGAASVTRTYSVKAGESIDEDVILGAGIAAFKAEYVPGEAVQDDIFMEVFEAKKALDGTRKSLGYNYGGEQDFTLPSGNYVLAYTLDGTKGEIPFNVATGERTDVTINLDAGVLNVIAPNGDYIEVLSAKKDIAGNSQSFDYGFGPEWMTTLKAGDYVVITDKNGNKSETPITIKAGERFEMTVEAAPAGKTK